MKTVRFAIIGCGVIGKVHAQVIKSVSGAQLVAVADINESAGAQMAQEFGCEHFSDYNDVLKRDDIDAISICLPSGLHHQVTLDAAKAKKHILTEKPIDIDLSYAQEMVEVCNLYGVKFTVVLQHRFDTAVQTVKQAQKRGEFGKLLWGSAKTIWYRDEEYFAGGKWKGTWKLDGGGALMNQSIHMIDLLLYFLGNVKSVSGKCRTLLHHDIETEDVGVAHLEFENGSIGTIEGTTAAYPGIYTELCLYGEKGTAVIRNDQLFYYSFKEGSHPEFEKILDPKTALFTKVETGVNKLSHEKQYDDFIHAILEDREPFVSGEDALKSLELIQSIYASSAEKKEIYLNQN